jgi:hypothetical protein
MQKNGKGDSPRKKSVSWKVWDKNYEKIFGKQQKNSIRAVDKPIKHDTIEESKREDQSRD